MGKKKTKASPSVAGESGGKTKKYKSKEKLPALGEISHVALSTEQEDVLLALFKQLDGTQTHVVEESSLADGADAASASAQSGSDSDSDSSDESGEDTFPDVVEPCTELELSVDDIQRRSPLIEVDGGAFLSPTGPTATARKPIHSAERKLMIRQMLRDDRRKSIDRLEQKDAIKQAKKDFKRSGAVSEALVGGGVTRRVRLSVVHTTAYKTVASHSYVVPRSEEGLEDLYLYCRRDFGFDSRNAFALCLDPAGERAVTLDSVSCCDDGTVVYVVSGDKSCACVTAIDETGVTISSTGGTVGAAEGDEMDGSGEFVCWTPRCDDPAASRAMKTALLQFAACSPSISDEAGARIIRARRSLPIYAMKNELLRMVNEHGVVVVAGDTGSGKSTQLPQYLLEDAILRDMGSETFIICTQPRRLSAISLAERVRDEMAAGSIPEECVYMSAHNSLAEAGDGTVTAREECEPTNFKKLSRQCGSDLCAYEVRLKSTLSKSTRILYCTTGILLRKLQSPEFLKNVSHVILDEVHERQVEMDFLCAILKSQKDNFPQLKLILMSATLDEEKISSYYRPVTSDALTCPVLRIPGRMFPVQVRYSNEIPKFFTRWGRLRGVTGRQSSISNGEKDIDIYPTIRKTVSASGRVNGSAGLSDGTCDTIEENSHFSPPSPVCDVERIVELMRSIVNKHRTEFPQDYVTPASGNSDAPGQAILLFLSGLQDIRRVELELRKAEYYVWLPNYATDSKEEKEDCMDFKKQLMMNAPIQIHILHSTISPEQQRRVFRRTRPGEWKIILSTNIAETSVTIDDVTHVIDTGLVKLVGYDPTTHVSTLVEQPISIASARQRAGRAGRTRPGECWRLSGEGFWSSEGVMGGNCACGLSSDELAVGPSRAAEKTPPEILRMPLEDIILKVLKLNLGRPEDFLATCMDAPNLNNIRLAISRLVDMGAIDPGQTLTLSPLGHQIAMLPMDALLAKMLIFATVLDCVDYALTVAAYLSGKSPFMMTLHKKDEYYKKFLQYCPKRHPFSDHMAVVNIYAQWHDCLKAEGREAAFQFCRDNYLSYSVLEDILMLRELFAENLSRAGLVLSVEAVDRATTMNSEKLSLLNCCLCAGLYPNVVRVCRLPVKITPDGAKNKRGSKPATYKTKLHVLQADGREVSFHPSSLLHRQAQSILNDSKDAYVVFHKKLASASAVKESATIHLHDASVIPAAALVLFAPNTFLSNNRKRIVIDHWIHFSTSELHAVMLLRLNSLVKAYLKSRVESPTCDLSTEQSIIIGALLALIGRKNPLTAKKLFS